METIQPESALESLGAFRNDVYQSFPHRADALMDLLDAMTSGSNAPSVIEHSQNPLFRREYGSLHDAIHCLADDHAALQRQQRIWADIAAKSMPEPSQRTFHLLGIDTTGCPRPYATTLADRTVNYHPNPVQGNKPIQVGHVYSLVAALPEKDDPKAPPSIIPLNITRVPADQKAVQIAVAQMEDLLNDEALPFQGHLTALTGDSVYGAREFLHPMAGHPDLVIIVRVRGNRTLYQQAPAPEVSEGKGHPVWYGEKFVLSDPSTFGVSDQSMSVPFLFKNGREAVAQITAWDNLLMRGKHEIPMHQHPFTLVRIIINDTCGNQVFKRPLWLIMMGERRKEIPLSAAMNAYRQRYDLEHFFRFGKQKLLLTGYPTAEIQYEENWTALVLLAYQQLYHMARVASRLPRPWERHLPRYKNLEEQEIASPAETMRDAARILKKTGTPAGEPKQRGKAPGRRLGRVMEKREKRPVIIKGKKKSQKSKGSSP